MTAKFDNFVSALRDLCREYGVALSTTGHDWLQVLDIVPGINPLQVGGIEDRTRPALSPRATGHEYPHRCEGVEVTRSLESIMRHYGCSAEAAARYVALRDEDYSVVQAVRFAGLTDPTDLPSKGPALSPRATGRGGAVQVHHINGDPTDNRPENLQVVKKKANRTVKEPRP